MHKSDGRGFLLRAVVFVTAVCAPMTAWVASVNATITQGDFSIYGTFKTQESGRWGEGGTTNGPTAQVGGQVAPRETGGSFDFNHWDLVQMRQTVDLRPDYKIVKNYNLLGRMDSLFVQDADVFATYRGWYDAFPDLKSKGVSEPAKQWELDRYTERQKTAWYRRDDLREYYLQADVTDSLSFRIGKQQVIWTEADFFGGTDVIDTIDLRYHWTHFEAPEDLRRNIQMIKMNYQIPDFWGIANNIFEVFWIPTDYQGGAGIINVSDPREPYIARVNPAELNHVTDQAMGPIWNSFGMPVDTETVADAPHFPVIVVPAGATLNGAIRKAIPTFFNLFPGGTGPLFLDYNVMGHSETPSKSLHNAQYGARYSWLLPIGNGLQMSFIYLFLARFDDAQLSPRFDPSAPFYMGANGSPNVMVAGDEGTFVVLSQSFPTVPGGLPYCGVGSPTPGVGLPNCRIGTIAVLLEDKIRRTHIFGLTGTYYDKDLTDIVFRYDFAWRPQYPVGISNGFGQANVSTMEHDYNPSIPTAQIWKSEAVFVMAFDRPTYIPWLSKQHTFLVFQNSLNWFPDRPKHAVLNGLLAMQKLRETQDLITAAALDWVLDGRLTTLNAVAWDPDDNVGALISTNSYRYSANVILGLNFEWYVGRSGRHTDPFLLSHNQRINEVELRATYEL